MKHETEYDIPDPSWEPDVQPSLEAQVVNVADEVAYNAHDLDDGLRSGHLSSTQVAEVRLVGELMNRLGYDPHSFDTGQRYVLIRELLGDVITDVVHATHRRLQEHGIETLDDVRQAESKLLGPSEEMQEQLAELKSFLYQNFYFHHRLIRMTRKAHQVLERMYNAYLDTPDMLPPHVAEQVAELGLERAVTDYLAGMTDRYANDEYRRLFDPTALT